MPLPEVLRSLLTATGPSGYETAPAAVFRDAASAFAETSVDVMGTSLARVPGTGDGPTLAVVGHIDEIGLIVTHVDDSGFLRFTGVGGWDPQILVGQRVELATRDGVVPGVIGKKPIHLLSRTDRKKVAEVKDLHIDVGAKDADEARGLVRIGDVAVLAGDPIELPNGRAVGARWTTAGLLRRLRGRAARRRGGRRPRRRRRRRRGAGGDDVRRLGDHRLLAAARRRGDRRRHARDRHARRVRGRDRQARVRLRAGHRARLEHQPAGLSSASSRPPSARGHRVHRAGQRAHTGTDLDAVHISRGGNPVRGIGIPLRYMALERRDGPSSTTWPTPLGSSPPSHVGLAADTSFVR
jgi:endoglucanase